MMFWLLGLHISIEIDLLLLPRFWWKCSLDDPRGRVLELHNNPKACSYFIFLLRFPWKLYSWTLDVPRVKLLEPNGTSKRLYISLFILPRFWWKSSSCTFDVPMFWCSEEQTKLSANFQHQPAGSEQSWLTRWVHHHHCHRNYRNQ